MWAFFHWTRLSWQYHHYSLILCSSFFVRLVLLLINWQYLHYLVNLILIVICLVLLLSFYSFKNSVFAQKNRRRRHPQKDKAIGWHKLCHWLKLKVRLQQSSESKIQWRQEGGGKVQDKCIAKRRATAAKLMSTSIRRHYETAKESRLSLITCTRLP